jgi:hypothetical protein
LHFFQNFFLNLILSTLSGKIQQSTNIFYKLHLLAKCFL